MDVVPKCPNENIHENTIPVFPLLILLLATPALADLTKIADNVYSYAGQKNASPTHTLFNEPDRYARKNSKRCRRSRHINSSAKPPSVSSACSVRADHKAALRRKQLPYLSPKVKIVPGAIPIPSSKAASYSLNASHPSGNPTQRI